MLKHTYDGSVDAWYFTAAGNETKTIVATQELKGVYHVMLDYDEDGNIVGVELI